MEAHSLRIVAVEDSPRVRQNLAAVLDLAGRQAGLRIEITGQAGDGQAGVELARAPSPDVILIDPEMPALGGYKTPRRIKTLEAAPRVVILSVHAGPEERERARAAGADGFVVKGAPYQTLLNNILGRDGSANSFDLEKGEKT